MGLTKAGLVTNPMPPVPAFEVFRMKIIGSTDESMTCNVLTYISDIPLAQGTRSELIAFATAFTDVTGPWTPYKNCLCASWEAVRLECEMPTHPSVATYHHNVAGQFGADAGPAMPNQVAVTIQKQTLWRGKHGRGRISVPSVPRTSVTGSRVTVNLAYQGLADSLQAAMAGGGHNWLPGVLSLESVQDLPQYGWVNTVAHAFMETLGTARRRKPGVGV